jgi:uncharacterized protein YndB with AHSA1/START domain
MFNVQGAAYGQKRLTSKKVFMPKGLVVVKSVFIDAGPAAVWDALVNPKKIKQYLFGTDTVSEWKVGSRITYKGEWQGKQYEDGGTILQLVPEKILQSTYWSSMSGTENKPENYATVTYELTKKDGGTLLSLTQDNCKTEEQKKHLEENWSMVLQGIKKVVEGKK